MTDYTNYKDPTGFIKCNYCQEKVSFPQAFLCCQIGFATCRSHANRPCPKCNRQRNRRFQRVENIRKIGKEKINNEYQKEQQHAKINHINDKQKTELIKCNQCGQRVPYSKAFFCCQQFYATCRLHSNETCLRCHKQRNLIFNINQKKYQTIENDYKEKISYEDKNNKQKIINNVFLKCLQCNYQIKRNEDIGSVIDENNTSEKNQKLVICKSCCQYAKKMENHLRIKQKQANNNNAYKNQKDNKSQNKEVLKCVSCDKNVQYKTSQSIQGLQDSNLRICLKCKQESLKYQNKKQEVRGEQINMQKNKDFFIKKDLNINEFQKSQNKIEKQRQSNQSQVNKQKNDKQEVKVIQKKQPPKIIFLKVQKIQEKDQQIKPKNNQNQIKRREQKSRRQIKYKNSNCLQSKYLYKQAKKEEFQSTPTGQQLQFTQIEEFIQDDQQQLRKNPNIKAKIIQEQNAIVEDQFIQIEFRQENQSDMVSCVDCGILIQKTNALSPQTFKEQQFLNQKQRMNKQKSQQNKMLIYMCKSCFVHQHLISRRTMKSELKEYRFEQQQKKYQKNENIYMNNKLINKKQQKDVDSDLIKSQLPNNYQYKDNVQKTNNNYIHSQDKKIENDIQLPAIQRRTYSENVKVPNADFKIDRDELKKSPIYQYAVKGFKQNQVQNTIDKNNCLKCKKCNKSQQKLGSNGICVSCFMNIMAPSLLPNKSSS